MPNNNKVWWGVGIVAALALLAYGYYGSQSANEQAKQTGPIKIGVIGPLTGDAAIYGEPLRNTVALAVDEINAKGGLDGRQIEPIYEDGKCNGQDAVSAGRKLIDSDKVEAILGGFCSGETLAVVPIAESAKVLLASPSASSPALTGISNYFFRNYPSDAAQGKSLAEVANKKGWKKVAFIQEKTDYAQGIYGAFDSAFKEFGGQTTNEAFPSDTSDFRSVITKIKATSPDALFIDTQAPQATARILKQLTELGWKPPLLVADIVPGDPKTVSENATALEGAIGAEVLTDESGPQMQHLINAYKERYGQDLPYRGYMSAAYDLVYLLKDGISAVGYDGEKLAVWSRTVQKWPGASGSITIGQNGDPQNGHSPEIIKGGKVERLQLEP